MTKKTVADLKTEFNTNLADNTGGDITPQDIREAFTNTIDSALVPENNLSDVNSAATARTNLGLEIGTDVQAYSVILQNTTASYTTTLDTKLDNIEENADVTDTANVDAAGAVMETDFNAHTILQATIDNTPSALTVPEQTLVGRITGGNITALTPTETRTLLNVEDGATADQTQEEIQDAAWAAVSGGTQTLITVTYQDATNDVDFVVDNNLANYDNTTSAFITANSSDTLTNKSGNISQWTNDVGYITATLTNEQVQDIVGGMVSGNTETLITVTYQDVDGTLDFVVDNNLANYDNTTSGFITASSTDTLTNKTLTSPVLNGSLTGTGVLDDDTFTTASATTVPTSESVKAYVDASGGGEWVELLNNAAVNDADITLDNTVIDGTYCAVLIELSGVTLSAGGNEIKAYVANASGTIQTSGYYYRVNGDTSGSTNAAGHGSASGSGWSTDAQLGVDNDAGDQYDGWILITGLNNADGFAQYTSFVTFDASNESKYMCKGQGVYPTQVDNRGIRIAPTGGNILGKVVIKGLVG